MGEPSSVAYLTDLEGNWDKYIDFVSKNENFFLGADGKYHLKPGAHFVYGGDVMDRGAGSLRIVRELLRLQSEAKEAKVEDAVTLIMGNRDVNKIRLTSELSDAAMKTIPRGFFGENTKVNRLKWILERTMGAPQAFQFRREELAILSNKSPGMITDEAVLESYLGEVGPNGEFTRLLNSGKLAHRIGNTLFVHSGVTNENLGYVPKETEGIPDVNRWIEKLNLWYLGQIKTWKSSPENLKNGSLDLMTYVRSAPGRPENPFSVITGRNNDALNNPNLPTQSVMNRLMAEGIYRVIVGHTPVGQLPVVVIDPSGFQVVYGDNSYALNESRAHQINLKGKSLEVLSIDFSPVGLKELEGARGYSLELGQKGPLGKQLPDGSLLVAPHSAGHVSFALTPGFQPRYVIHSDEEVRLRGTGTVKRFPPLCRRVDEAAK